MKQQSNYFLFLYLQEAWPVKVKYHTGVLALLQLLDCLSHLWILLELGCLYFIFFTATSQYLIRLLRLTFWNQGLYTFRGWMHNFCIWELNFQLFILQVYHNKRLNYLFKATCFKACLFNLWKIDVENVILNFFWMQETVLPVGV